MSQVSAGMAQLVERPTEKPKAILTRVRVRGGARDFFFFFFFSPLPESTFSADSLTVSVQPPCEIACIDMCPRVKTPKDWQPYRGLDTRKYCTHLEEWVALLLRLLCLTRAKPHEFLARDNEALKKQKVSNVRSDLKKNYCYHKKNHK